MNKLLHFLFLFCTLPLMGYAQSFQLSGTVSDASDGNTLPGVTVSMQQKTATVTDIDGHYTLQVSKGDRVTFSYVGMLPQTVTIDNQRILDIVLQNDDKTLDEVVVIGYGVVKKRDLSGSIGQIKADDLLKGNPANSINQALQGKLAGVAVTQNDGAPGAGISIQIRGANSFSTNSQPLYIVDGVPFDTGGTPSTDSNNNQTSNPLALINPNNIESIEVLKDASATAIYGSRGANGVILITTQKGQANAGKEQIELSINFSTSQIGKRVNVLNAYDYANYINEQAINDEKYIGTTYTNLPYPGLWGSYSYTDGRIIPHTGRYVPSPEDFLNPRTVYDSYGNSSLVQGTDWQDEIYQTGYSQEYNLRASGGNAQGWHSFSGNYTSQKGTVVGSGYERYSFATNIGRKVHDWIELGMNLNYTNSTTDFAKSNAYDYSIIRSALIFPSSQNITIETSASDELGWLAANPYIYVRTAKDQLKTANVFTSHYVELTLTKWLKFRQNLGISYNYNSRSAYYGRHTQEGRTPTNGSASLPDNWWQGTTAESLLTYNQTFGIHSINAVVGYTYEQGNWGSKSISSKNFPSDVTEAYDISKGLSPQTPSSGRGQSKLVSLLGRVNYVLNDKYIFTASFRRDGSSKFVPGNKFANFASGAFAWRASEESFIKKLDIFSNLKLRLSYGQTGNQGINSYQTMPVLATANYSLGGTLVSGLAEQAWRGPLNPFLVWETTDQYNVGIDFGFLQNRLSVSIDYYNKQTHNLLQNVKIASDTGFSNRWNNFGTVSNNGLEITGNFVVWDNSQFKWSMDANISFNRNKIGGLEADQFANALWYQADQAFIQRNGCPIGAIFGFVEDGFYDNIAEVRDRLEYKTSSDDIVKGLVGEVKYRDLNGDGYITDADRTIIGNTNPDFNYGFTNNFSWKKLTFSFFLQGTQGNDMFNGNLMDVKLSNLGNIPQAAYDTRWTPETTATSKWPKATGGYNRVWRISDRYIEDGSYLRLKNVSLGYTLPTLVKGIESLYVYASASNLFTITNYSWFDPDVNAFGNDSSRKGVDIYSYPSSRTYSAGLKVTF